MIHFHVVSLYRTYSNERKVIIYINNLFYFSWFGVMKHCWEQDSNKRPTFSEIRNQLDQLFVAAPGDDYYYYKR